MNVFFEGIYTKSLSKQRTIVKLLLMKSIYSLLVISCLCSNSITFGIEKDKSQDLLLQEDKQIEKEVKKTETPSFLDQLFGSGSLKIINQDSSKEYSKKEKHPANKITNTKRDLFGEMDQTSQSAFDEIDPW